MKRSSFLAGLALLLLAPFTTIARMASRPVRFYWCYEDSEIYAARDLKELNGMMDDMMGTDFAVCDPDNRATWCKRDPEEYPRLTHANRGKQWDEVSSDEKVNVEQEDGSYVEMTYRESVEEYRPFRPCQVATAYN